jgi:hypothetical protein
MPITTDLDKFRLSLGDDEATQLFNDDEAEYFLEAAGSIAGAVALAVDALTLRYARQYDTTIDGQSFQRSQIAAMLEKRSGVLSSQRAGIVTQYVTRIDANSDDISAEDTRAHGTAGNRTGTWDPCGYDLDPDHDIPA